MHGNVLSLYLLLMILEIILERLTVLYHLKLLHLIILHLVLQVICSMDHLQNYWLMDLQTPEYLLLQVHLDLELGILQLSFGDISQQQVIKETEMLEF